MLYLFKIVVCFALLMSALGAWYMLWIGVRKIFRRK